MPKRGLLGCYEQMTGAFIEPSRLEICIKIQSQEVQQLHDLASLLLLHSLRLACQCWLMLVRASILPPFSVSNLSSYRYTLKLKVLLQCSCQKAPCILREIQATRNKDCKCGGSALDLGDVSYPAQCAACSSISLMPHDQLHTHGFCQCMYNVATHTHCITQNLSSCRQYPLHNVFKPSALLSQKRSFIPCTCRYQGEYLQAAVMASFGHHVMA